MPPKPADPFREINQMARCVQLFFSKRMNQGDIAAVVGIDQSTVSRLLKRALDENFYRVEFNFPPLVDLGTRLRDRYKLRDAVVVPTGDKDSLKEELGRAAARYFETVVRDGQRIGLSCGRTLFHFVMYAHGHQQMRLHIYPLAAEMSLRFADMSFNTLVGIMTAKYRPGATGYALPAQVFTKTIKGLSVREAFLKEPDIRTIFDEANDVDVSVVGIGGLDATTPGFCELASRRGFTIQQLGKLGVAGEFNYQPFSESGEPVRSKRLERITAEFIGVGLHRFRELSKKPKRLIVAIAGGTAKRLAIRGALAGGLFNVLVTDHDTAVELLHEK